MGRQPRIRAKTATWTGCVNDFTDTVPNLPRAVEREPSVPPKAARKSRATAAERPKSSRPTVLLDAIPKRLGAYEIIGVLGQGGMARVYLAEHSIIGKRVAIKMPLPIFAACSATHDVFLREARVVSTISHRNVVDVYDFSVDERGIPYCVMELAAGETLSARLEREPLLMSQTLDVIIAITDAISAVHAAGYLHRDIKSENIILTIDGRRLEPKLTDFGIAKALDPDSEELTEGMVGTPRTMAPEQIAQDEVDERTDIWALGVLLFEMLTGQLPFPTGRTLREDIVAIVTEPPRPLPPEFPDDIRAIVERCLRKDPEERPKSAQKLADLLRAARSRYLNRHRMIERALVADEAWSVIAELEAELRAA